VELRGQPRVVDEGEGRDEQRDVSDEQERQEQGADRVEEAVAARARAAEGEGARDAPREAVEALADGAVARARVEHRRVHVVDRQQQQADARGREEDGLHKSRKS
jgi:hypothetical protein